MNKWILKIEKWKVNYRIHSKRPDNPAIKRRKTNPTGTRTVTRQISPENPSQKTHEETETSRARKNNILSPQEWRKKRNTHESTHEWSNQPVKNKRTHHTQCPLTHATHTHNVCTLQATFLDGFLSYFVQMCIVVKSTHL